MRSSTPGVLVRHRVPLARPSARFLREDECVEVTPKAVRLRKVILDQTGRVKAARRARAGAPAAR